MMRLKHKFLNLSLKNKLIIAFSCLIIVPLFTIAGVLSWLYLESNRNMILDVVVENNNQIVKNIDTSLNPLLRLSMSPVQNRDIFRIMGKDYDESAYPLLEREQDFDKVNGLIRNNMHLYTDLIDSVIVYQSKNGIIIGRSNIEYMDHRYFEREFRDEPFVRQILDKQGLYVPIGIHPEKLMSYDHAPVVSIGRAIMDPYTKESLGLIMLNISVEKLKTLWSDIHFTENTRFYLIDEQHNIIYSQHPEEIGQAADSAIGEDFASVIGEGRTTGEHQDMYFVSSISDVSNWRAITIIPKTEMFSYIYLTLKITTISLIVLLALSILIAIFIATSITRPLAVLERKMKLVSQGNLDVSMDIRYGEAGKISKTVDHMLRDIRGLIRRIYEEEKEKRHLEMLALQSQIKPHFIYNTLNVIKWMAKLQGASGIEEALSSFSSVIKFTVKTESDYVTIQEEAEFIRSYTDILSLRYLNKFDVSFDIDPQVREFYTLKFLLQPLVENAVFHGFDGIDYKGKLTISIAREANYVIMIVADNGKGVRDDEREQFESRAEADKINPIGMKNIRKRLELNYGQDYGLTIASREPCGTVATIKIPVLTSIPNESAGERYETDHRR
ncbi:hypothetical protein PAE9249_00448 [Paenibacillus sp. CECT 9249]|uniref:cache domain-containing sensor histidine kinase n=1 Tax=Paenibacillus sp. CECT 9249 TaxID=2845385 RepID=UPI001E3D33CB|nr:sensor histidine kinase [Paenibacillus sp. CECT 9249]CAH0117983.1 hypothetical protein PAE9249_00448 [Paenibacillus sp. CECT 9249]